MNEQAIKDAYNLFVQQGYTKSIDEFKKLLSSNNNALNDSYNLFVKEGYTKSIDDFKGLMGVSAQPTQEAAPAEVKKKDTESTLADGSLVSQKPAKPIDETENNSIFSVL